MQGAKEKHKGSQKLVRTISSDRAKLKAYCDMGKLQEQMDQAEQNNDHEALEILDAKIDSLSQQISPDYVRIIDGLREIDPDSADGKRFFAVLDLSTNSVI